MIAGVRDQAAEPRPGAQGLERLTPRELEILELISAGMSNTAIAGRLSVMQRPGLHAKPVPLAPHSHGWSGEPQ